MTVDIQPAYEKFKAIDWAGTPFTGGIPSEMTTEQRAWVVANNKDPRALVADMLWAYAAPFNRGLTPELAATGWLITPEKAMQEMFGPLFDALREASN